jgi:F0F1-type ATP synthase membrane subunit a
MMAFEIFVSLIQAFIFSILASMYIAEAVHAEH